jgi:hypothetical protein
VKFTVLHTTCNPGNFDFYINGTRVHSMAPSQGCACTTTPDVVELTDPKVLALIHGCQDSFSLDPGLGGAGVALASFRVDVTYASSPPESVCIFDACNQGCAPRDVCGGYDFFVGAPTGKGGCKADCTGASTLCVGTKPVACPAPGPCFLPGKCASGEGCVNPPAPRGTACQDSKACVGQGICDGQGACVGDLASSCDDGVPCTVDACDPERGGCTHDATACPKDGQGPGPATAVTFSILHASCGAGPFDFYINGKTVGHALPARGCTCNAAPQEVTFTDPAALAWLHGAGNKFTLGQSDGGPLLALGYVKVAVTRAGGPPESVCLFDALDKGCAPRDVCAGSKRAAGSPTGP